MDSEALPSGGASGPARAGLTWLEGATLALLVAAGRHRPRRLPLRRLQPGHHRPHPQALHGPVPLPLGRDGGHGRAVPHPLLRAPGRPAARHGMRSPPRSSPSTSSPSRPPWPACIASAAGAAAAKPALLALLIAIPVRNGIANESLYRVQFSHSHLASALVIWAMALFLEGRRILPLLMLSLGAYIHVLYSIYVLVPCLLVVLWRRARSDGAAPCSAWPRPCCRCSPSWSGRSRTARP